MFVSKNPNRISSTKIKHLPFVYFVPSVATFLIQTFTTETPEAQSR